MRIVFRAIVMMTGLVLLAGVIGLMLVNQVLAAWPMRTSPVSPEDLIAWRNTLDAPPDSTPHS